ncbi:MAG: hypothetical protein HQL70_00735 [Magnetococcales bacterium]|nr:hypothetical protein [Magnetococcales bacterium]
MTNLLFATKKIFLTLLSLFLIGGCLPFKNRPEPDITGIYHIPKLPVDRAFIGYVWDKNSLPVKGDMYQPVQIVKETSFATAHNKFAHKSLLSFNGKPTTATFADEIAAKLKSDGIQTIKAKSLAKIPFEPGLDFVTEALGVDGLKMDADQSMVVNGGAGLVVGYKVQTIDENSYKKNTLRPVDLFLDQELSLSGSLWSKAQLIKINYGDEKPLSNVVMACAKAQSRKDEITAAWVVEIRYGEGFTIKSFKVGFPAYPNFADCQSYSIFITARVDHITGKIIRKAIHIKLDRATIDHYMNTAQWDARVVIEEDSFAVRTVTSD